VLRVLHNKAVKEVSVRLRSPRRLIPVHINNRPPSYYILGGLVFTPVTVPLLRSEYGKVLPGGKGAASLVGGELVAHSGQGLALSSILQPLPAPSHQAAVRASRTVLRTISLPQEFDYEAPVKLLDKMLHAQAENETQQARSCSFSQHICLLFGVLGPQPLFASQPPACCSCAGGGAQPGAGS
jgi:hypothetical protein